MTVSSQHLNAANQAIDNAFSSSSHTQRKTAAALALSEVQAGAAGLGTGLTFEVGPGSLMF